MRKWQEKTEISQTRILNWAGIWSSTFCHWCRSYGKVFEHNGWVPRDHWLTEQERQAILQFHFDHPLEGYRRLTYMMIDANTVACSPASVYRVLDQAGVLRPRNQKKSLKGTGFDQPQTPHRDWHVDIDYLNIRGTFYFIATVLDGYSRSIVHWAIGETMNEIDIEILLQTAREKFPDARPRIISDNGPQFIAKDFKTFVRICGMTHIRTSPYYPQSNGKIERYHRTLKSDCIRPMTPLTKEDAQRVVTGFVREYNETRLHSAIGYVTPADMLAGRQAAIHAERDRKLAEARAARQKARAEAREMKYSKSTRPEDRALLGSNSSAASMPVIEPPAGARAPQACSALSLATMR